MKFGIVGLGRMGANLSRQAIEKGYEVVGYDPNEQVRSELADVGLDPAESLEELASKLSPPRVVFVYVPHGEATDEVCRVLERELDRDDLVIDGGNSHWEDSIRRHRVFAEAGISFLDMGTSGGVSGARTGACFMAGGDRQAYEAVEPILDDLAVDPEGAIFVGEPGSGHFVKLVHNAIEFGMVQSIAEGVELLARSDYDIDLPAVLNSWNHGSVIRSWLIELMATALEREDNWDDLSTFVEDTGEVKWVLKWALDRDLPSATISQAQQALMEYRDLDWPAAKAVALLRSAYGEHPVHRGSDAGRKAD
jgi:6-phosphogluconate dehydrogenase